MKVRLLMKDSLNDWSVQNGPGIADTNDIYFLKDEPWLEIKMSSIEECKRDGVIPWLRSGVSGAVKEAEILDWPIIIGPNAVFADSTQPYINKLELNSPVVKKLLMLDYTNINKAKTLSNNPDNIKKVSHFMRPELYDEPFYFKHEWNLLCSVKTGLSARIVFQYQNHTSLHNGFYTFKELKYKAQHSKACIHACHYENYGLAIHEISLLGCPIVYDNKGFKPGSIGKGMGVEVSSVETQNLQELEDAVEKVMSMDRKKVWEASHDFQNPKKLKEIYRRAILDD